MAGDDVSRPRRRAKAPTAPKRRRGRPKAQMPPPPTPFPAALLRGVRRTAGDGATGEGVGASSPAALCLPSPDWLRHRLTVGGPADELATFQQAAAGSGIIPWRVDFVAQEEGWFNLMAGLPKPRRQISIDGAHILAGQLRDAMQAQHAAAEQGRRARICPLDLHALVPVPPEILARGPEDPAALAWLWAHWGTTWPLRHVAEKPVAIAERRRLPDGEDMICFAFSAADWSPWQALLRMRARWPVLAFALQPEYGG